MRKGRWGIIKIIQISVLLVQGRFLFDKVMRKIITAFILLYSAAGAQAHSAIIIGVDTLRFGSVSVNGSHIRTFDISNTGDSTLMVNGLNYPNGAFRLLTPVLPDSIPAGQRHSYGMVFEPMNETSYDGILCINSNDPLVQTDSIQVKADGIQAFAPGDIIWSFQGIANVISATSLNDVNNDGFPDVIAESFDAGVTGNNLSCISGSGQGTGQVIWSAQPMGHSNAGGYGNQCLAAVSDLNSNGSEDIIFGTGWDSQTIFGIEGRTGQIICSFNTFNYPPSGWVYSVASMGDLNDDGKPEILAGLGSDANQGLCLNGANGARLWKRASTGTVFSVCRVNDVTGDHAPDAILGTGDGDDRIFCLSGALQDTGRIMWSYHTGASISSVKGIGDLNNDGYCDIIVGTYNVGDRVFAISGHVDSTHTRLIWSTPVGEPVMGVVISPDLDGDSLDDILVESWGHYTLALSGADGHEIWRNMAGDDVWAVYPTDDFTHDNVPEVVAGSFNGNVMLINGATGQTIWSTHTDARILTITTIPDINGDSLSDIIAGQELLNGIGGKLFVIAGGAQIGQEGIPNSDLRLPEDYFVLNNYPNPFNSETVVSYELSAPSNVVLEIYNIIGQRVRILINESEQPGLHRAIWDGLDLESKSVSSGVYFARITAGGRSSTRKLTVLR
jgi:outer membrane protein assembly factor BamB